MISTDGVDRDVVLEYLKRMTELMEVEVEDLEIHTANYNLDRDLHAVFQNGNALPPEYVPGIETETMEIVTEDNKWLIKRQERP